ncbi:hypothetical protein [Pseudomonas sp. 1121_17]|uniref:hypothetical protein n=1 Tax=Pseudomonas sp. 1121_17 TaxID=2604458 RepID=UPI004063C225
MGWPQWLTSEKVIGCVLALLVPGAYTLAYQIQQGRIEDRDKTIEARNKEIDSLTTAKTWDVPNTINRLTDISKTLQKQFASIEELKALRSQNELLNSKIASIVKEDNEKGIKLQALSEKNQNLEKSLAKAIVSDEVVDIRQGEAKQLIKNHLVLGVESVYPTSGIYGVLGKEQVAMKVGETKEFGALGKDCRLTLTSTAYPRASFSFVCF